MKKDNIEDILNKRYGKLVVIEEVESFVYGRVISRRFLCQCDCGNTKAIHISSLKKGVTTSCGCYNRESASKRATKHGLAMDSNGKKHLDYQIWSKIKSRCYNDNCKDYKDYGARGITMCESWRNSFKSFIEDMGFRPDNKYSIERLDVNGDYTKDNCIWILKSDQPKNTRKVQKIIHNGKEMILSDWCKELNLSYSMMRHRVYDLQIPFEVALLIPKGNKLLKYQK